MYTGKKITNKTTTTTKILISKNKYWFCRHN